MRDKHIYMRLSNINYERIMFIKRNLNKYCRMRILITLPKLCNNREKCHANFLNEYILVFQH